MGTTLKELLRDGTAFEASLYEHWVAPFTVDVEGPSPALFLEFDGTHSRGFEGAASAWGDELPPPIKAAVNNSLIGRQLVLARSGEQVRVQIVGWSIGWRPDVRAGRAPTGTRVDLHFRTVGPIIAAPCETRRAILVNGSCHGLRIEVPSRHDHFQAPDWWDRGKLSPGHVYALHRGGINDFGPFIKPGMDLRAVERRPGEQDAVYFVHEPRAAASAELVETMPPEPARHGADEPTAPSWRDRAPLL